MKEMQELLLDLKNNYDVVSLKSEFEAEGATLAETQKLQELAQSVGLGLTIKIGGCEAIKELKEAKAIGATSIVAPMVETAYAMQKYVRAINSVFLPEEKQNLNTLINIETICGFNSLQDILVSPYFQDVDGIILGRDDMTSSMNLSTKDVNSNVIFSMAETMSEFAKKSEKSFIVGGGVCSKSIPFLKKLQNNHLTQFETRKVVFNASSLAKSNIEEGILKALKFELLWLKNKRDNNTQDELRIKTLENRMQDVARLNF